MKRLFLYVAVPAVIAVMAASAPARAAVTLRPSNTIGLLTWWKLDEGSGTTASDSSGSGNAGAFSGSPSWVAGKSGNGLRFSSSGQAVSRTVTASPTSYSVSAWIRYQGSVPISSIKVAVAYGSGAVGTLWMGYFSNGKLAISNSSADLTSSTVVNDTNWHQVVAVISGGTLTGYVDGTLLGSESITSRPGDTLKIGDYMGASLPFNGIVDDVKVYNRALAAGEVSTLYQSEGSIKAGVMSGGLTGSYYNGLNFNTFISSHTDATVNFDPADSLGVSYANSPDGDTFSVRWTGYVKPDYSQTYTFYTSSDDGTRLYVNNALVVDSWIDQGTTEHSGTIALQAGRWYPITLEFYENGGGAAMTLSWSALSVAKAIIPAASLSHAPTLVSNASSVTLQNGSTLTRGLLGHWTFDGADFTTAVADKSGQGNAGYLPSGVATTSSKTAGKMGQALKLNGTSSYVDIPASSGVNPTGAITVSGWIKTTEGTTRYVASKHEDSFYLSVGVAGTNKAGFYLNGVSAAWLGGTSDINDNRWHLITGTFDGSTIRLYVDGVQESSAARTGTIDTGADTIQIGARNGTDLAEESLDDIRIYDRALSAAEVLQLYRIGK